MRYFISGHRDLTAEDFKKYYIPRIDKALREDRNASFVVGDCNGADSMAQDYLRDNGGIGKTTVYHMFEKPRYLGRTKFSTRGGFKDDVSRDSAMTENSDIDIAVIGYGRWTSGTAQNILRRFEVDMGEKKK